MRKLPDSSSWAPLEKKRITSQLAPRRRSSVKNTKEATILERNNPTNMANT